MPLNPVLQRLIKKAYLNNFDKVHTFSTEQMRQFLTHPKIKTTPASFVDLLTDKAIHLRCYTPKHLIQESQVPCVFYISATAFIIDRLDASNDYCSLMANSLNMKVINIAHRLAPEHKFPRFLNDCIESIEWVYNSADKFQIDPNKLAIWGESSGGSIAASCTHVFKQQDKPILKHQTLFYPMVDLVTPYPSKKQFESGYMLDKSFIQWLDDRGFHKEQDRSDPLASPLLSDSFLHLPPACIITAGFDPLRDEGELYKDKLHAAKVPVFHNRFDSMIHGFMRFYNKVQDAKIAMQTASNQVKLYLNP